jgi:hypothetical protein
MLVVKPSRAFFILPFTAVCCGLAVLMYCLVHSAQLALQPICKEQKQKRSNASPGLFLSSQKPLNLLDSAVECLRFS